MSSIECYLSTAGPVSNVKTSLFRCIGLNRAMLQNIQRCAVIARSIFLQISTKDNIARPLRVFFAGSNFHLYSDSVTIVMCAISCHIRSRYDGTWLYTARNLMANRISTWTILWSCIFKHHHKYSIIWGNISDFIPKIENIPCNMYPGLLRLIYGVILCITHTLSMNMCE